MAEEARSEKVEIKGPKRLKISLRNGTSSVQVAQLYLGGSKEHSSDAKPAFFKFDINNQNIILQKTKDFSCKLEQGCTIPSPVTRTITFRRQKVEGLEIVPKLSFDLSDTSSSARAFMPGSSTPKDVFQPGINYMGLSPHSPFWDFLEDNYNFYDPSGNIREDEIEVSIVYGISPKDPKFYQKKFRYDDSFEKSYITINGQSYGQDETYERLKIGETIEQDFIFRGYKLRGLDQDVSQGLNLCITNTADFLIAVKDPEKAKQSIFRNLCGNEKKCRKHNSFVDRISPIVLEAQDGTQIKIGQREFIHIIDDHRVDLAIEGLSKFKNASCPVGTNVALGIQFLATNEVTIIKKRNYKKFQWYVSKIKIPDNPMFKYKENGTLGMIGEVLEISIWVIFGLFLVYVLIVKKKLGIKSRVVKETTKFQPYLFSAEGEDKDGFL